MGTTIMPPNAPTASSTGTATRQSVMKIALIMQTPINCPSGKTAVAWHRRKRLATSTAPTTTPRATMPCR